MADYILVEMYSTKLNLFRTYFVQLHVRMNYIYSAWRWKCMAREEFVACCKALHQYSHQVTKENMEALS
jgi:hypothetical protein